MACEIRKVTPDWKHPIGSDGFEKPLMDGFDYQRHLEQWEKERKILTGKEARQAHLREKPQKKDYMLAEIPMNQRTCYQAYSNVSEGRPISRIFKTRKGMLNWTGWKKEDFNAHLESQYPKTSG